MKQDLTWFFNDAMHHLGYSSSFSSFKYRMEGGRPIPSVEPITDSYDRICRFIRKYNKIFNILKTRFTSQERAMLNGLFNHELKYPPVIKATFAEYTGIAVFDSDIQKLFYSVEYKTGIQIRANKDILLAATIKRKSKEQYKTLEDKYNKTGRLHDKN